VTDKSDLHRLCAWWIQEFGRVRCVEFNVLRVREARDKLHTEGRGPATVNRYLSAMRSAWNWARSAGGRGAITCDFPKENGVR